MSNGISDTVEMTVPEGLCLVWAMSRSKANSVLTFGLALMSTTQGDFGFCDIAGDKFSGASRDGSKITFTFTVSTYWQVNVLYIASMG